MIVLNRLISSLPQNVELKIPKGHDDQSCTINDCVRSTFNEFPILKTSEFADFSSEKRVRQIHFYGHNKVTITLEGSERVAIPPDVLEGFPKLNKEQLTAYLSQAHFKVSQFSDGCFKVSATPRLSGGGGNVRKIHRYAFYGDEANMQETLVKKVPQRYQVDVLSQGHFSDEGSYTAFQIAWSKRHFGIVKLLAKAGANVNVKIGLNILQLARREAFTIRVTEYKDKFEPYHIVGTKEFSDKTALEMAYIELNDKELSKVLIEAGAHITPKFLSAVCSQNDVSFLDSLHKLLKKDRIVDTEKNTPLHYAEDAPVVEYLLSCGYNIDSFDASGLTPLAKALNQRKLLIATMLLEKGADMTKVLPSVLAELGPDAQYLIQAQKQKAAASRSMNTQSMPQMVSSQQPPLMPQMITPQPSSSNLLNDACQRGDLKAVQSCGLQPDSKTLTFACISGKMEIVELVISRGAKPDNETLTTACASNNPAIVKKVIDCGAKPTKQTIEIARQTKNFEIIDLILTLMSQSF